MIIKVLKVILLAITIVLLTPTWLLNKLFLKMVDILKIR